MKHKVVNNSHALIIEFESKKRWDHIGHYYGGWCMAIK